MKRNLASGIVASLVCATAAMAQEAPNVAFDATYKSSGPNGGSTVRMLSDGKGKMRTETSVSGQKMITIMDYPNKVAYTIMEAQKMIMKSPLKAGTNVHDDVSAKKANAKSLGAKTVAGHPCHGWEYSADGGKTIVWNGDDINYMVKSETSINNGAKMSTELVTFAKTTPAANNFQVPSSGYKLMTVPGQ